jgi:hypothetical protein
VHGSNLTNLARVVDERFGGNGDMTGQSGAMLLHSSSIAGSWGLAGREGLLWLLDRAGRSTSPVCVKWAIFNIIPHRTGPGGLAIADGRKCLPPQDDSTLTYFA